MSDLHDLYLVACGAKNGAKAPSDAAFGLDAKKEINFGQETPSAFGKEKNTPLALTFAGAFEPNISLADKKLASKNALEAQEYAKEAIEAYKSNRAKKEAVKQEIADLESIRKKDAEELKIIRIGASPIPSRASGVPLPSQTSFSRNAESEGMPELSDSRKLYYRACKEMEKEMN